MQIQKIDRIPDSPADLRRIISATTNYTIRFLTKENSPITVRAITEPLPQQTARRITGYTYGYIFRGGPQHRTDKETDVLEFLANEL